MKALPTNFKLVMASEDDYQLHEQILAEIAKASKKDPVWSPLSVAK
jgi:DNA polymerase-3 subunit epsilon